MTKGHVGQHGTDCRICVEVNRKDATAFKQAGSRLDTQQILNVTRKIADYYKSNPGINFRQLFMSVMEDENYHGDREDIRGCREEFARLYDVDPHDWKNVPALGNLNQPE